LEDFHSGDALWEALVEAERDVVRKRAAFLQTGNTSRIETLRSALLRPSWDQKAALSFLARLYDDVPALMDELVELAVSDRTTKEAKNAIAAPGRRSDVTERLGRCVVGRLSKATPEDCRHFIDMLFAAHAWEALTVVLDYVKDSEDPEMRAIADDYSSEWTPPRLS
jgi:hypothetical protein